MKAYDYLLRGRYFLGLGTKDGVLKARRCFEQGLELNPESAATCASLADSYAIEYEAVWAADRLAASGRALQIAERAVALDPSDSVTWHALAWAQLTRRQYDLSMISIERAIALNPNE